MLQTMKRITSLLLVLTMACSMTVSERAFVNAATSKEILAAAYTAFRNEIMSRFGVCMNLPEPPESHDELNECMGNGYHVENHDAVVAALGEYIEAAQELGELITNNASDARIKSQYLRLFAAAIKLLEAIPDAKEELTRLKKLVRSVL